MWKELRSAAICLLLLTLLTGVVYPLAVTGLGHALFPAKAAGDTTLLGQPFDAPRYFWGRLSATTPGQYNAGASTGSNLGPTNPALVDAAKARIAVLRAADPTATGAVPVDLVTASASGLDPHISPEAAYFQAPRVARIRGLDPARVAALVAEHVEGPDLGILGDPRVNVVALNRALDAMR